MKLAIAIVSFAGQVALAAFAILALMVALVEMPEPANPLNFAPETKEAAVAGKTAEPDKAPCIAFQGM